MAENSTPTTTAETPQNGDAAPAKKRETFKKRNEIPTAEELLASFNRALPFSDEAEKGVLSCLLQDPRRAPQRLPRHPPGPSLSITTPTAPSTRSCWSFTTKNLPVDPVTLTHALRDQNLLDKVGGAAAISELFAFVPYPLALPLL
jgi:replicative DNA helicase